MFESKAEAQSLGNEAATAPTVEISNAISHIHKQFVGRGPANTRTTVDGDLVVCLLEGGYTRAEETLEGNDQSDVVAAGRLGLQDAMREAMIGAVERTLGRSVLSFMSANDIRQNFQVEVFVLSAPRAEPEPSLA
ncbi:MAG TPA: Na-translocating system protein MpsC family protein [Solirubrobacterales bacterium]|nr:Na-translocating system protein MpsC family protein [Solirubrobacterales bacterium]